MAYTLGLHVVGRNGRLTPNLVLPDLLHGLALPADPAALAAILVGGEVRLGGDVGSGFDFAGTITAAEPIPEPGSGVLLLSGLAALARWQRREAVTPKYILAVE